MTAKSWGVSYCAALLALSGNGVGASFVWGAVDPPKAQIIVLYDAFGLTSEMQKDWGYAALVEYGGKRILFDTGNNPDILAHNADACRLTSRMPMDIRQAFLDNAEQRKLIVAVETLDGCGEIERYLNTAACCEPIDVFRQCRLQANLVQKRRI